MSYNPQFSTAELRKHPPAPLHESLGNRIHDAFIKQTDPERVGYLDLSDGEEVDLDDGREKSFRTPDLLFTIVPPQSLKQDPQDVAVLEVGLSQSYKDFRGCVGLWFEGNSMIKMVFLVKLTESPRYSQKANVEHVRESGLQNFPTTISVRDVQSDPNDPAGCLSIHGVQMMGKLTGFMEIWVRDEESSKPAQKGERIECHSSPTVCVVCKQNNLNTEYYFLNLVLLQWEILPARHSLQVSRVRAHGRPKR